MSWWRRWWKKSGKGGTSVIYYVAGDGNDADDGIHPLTAWQTIHRLNQHKHKIKRNDQILFKRGYTYTGTPFYLDKPKYTSLRIGAYGSGRHPVFPDIKNQYDSI